MAVTVNPPRMVSFWGGEVTWLERLCARSMVEAGHSLTIYSYEPHALREADLPAEIRDAREIMSRELFDSYREVGRFALFSDVFRLQLQLQGKGIWVDLDCYVVKQLRPAGEYVFGLLAPGKLNGAVLGLPATSPMALDYISAISAVPLRTPWATFRRRLKRNLEILAGRPLPRPKDQTNIGPRALTYFAKKHDVMKHAVPQDVFYPVASKHATVFAAADDRAARAAITDRTVIVHLWRTMLKEAGLLDNLPPPTSYLGQCCQRFGLTDRNLAILAEAHRGASGLSGIHTPADSAPR